MLGTWSWITSSPRWVLSGPNLTVWCRSLGPRQHLPGSVGDVCSIRRQDKTHDQSLHVTPTPAPFSITFQSPQHNQYSSKHNETHTTAQTNISAFQQVPNQCPRATPRSNRSLQSKVPSSTLPLKMDTLVFSFHLVPQRPAPYPFLHDASQKPT